MCALVAPTVGTNRTPQEREAQYVLARIVAIFAIVEECRAVVAFREIRPLVSTHLELRLFPTRVAMSSALDVSEGQIVGRAASANREGKRHLQ